MHLYLAVDTLSLTNIDENIYIASKLASLIVSAV